MITKTELEELIRKHGLAPYVYIKSEKEQFKIKLMSHANYIKWRENPHQTALLTIAKDTNHKNIIKKLNQAKRMIDQERLRVYDGLTDLYKLILEKRRLKDWNGNYMSRKYNITLFNRVTGEEDYFQLFGNSEWFPTLEKYLDSKGIDYREDYPYISDENSLEITDLAEFVQAIDETVFYDIIHKKDKKSTDPLSSFENYSQYFNFTDNFVCFDNDGLTVIPHTSIYNAALTISNNSYVFQSYKLVQWLLENNAIENEQATWTKHKYNLDAGQDENITILGQLDPDYKLTLAYW